MAMYGADVAELRTLAQQFERSAQQLEACRATLGGQVRSTPWTGPDSARFGNDWTGTHSPRVDAAAAALRDAANRLRANADQQEQASAVDGGWEAGLPGLPLPGDLIGGFRFGDADWGTVPVSADAGGRSIFSWLQGGLDWTPDRSAPIFGSFDVGFFASKIPGVGNVVSAIGMGDVLTDPDRSVLDKVWGAGGFVVDVASGALKSVPNPITYLTGVAGAQVWDVVDLAAHTDWGLDQAKDNWDYVMSDPGGAAVGAAQAVVDYVPDLIDNLWPF
ncbi:WXG100 family type VII secretion target [Agromyces sp. MMS24-K17]|uniref:WXG100 family type VII secretion target n=1 Tax=Agromyces sp. MMS24-K17 TaxID=3372850 RepID=UPI00375463D2